MDGREKGGHDGEVYRLSVVIPGLVTRLSGLNISTIMTGSYFIDIFLSRHARTCCGHPRLSFGVCEGVDGRNKSGHDDEKESCCVDIQSE